LPPNPIEVTEGGAPLICAAAMESNKKTDPRTAKTATKA